MRLGIMGGTFDPIHQGHLFIARLAMEEADLDSMLFLPDGDPPHKRPGASAADRLAMVRLAIQDEQGFEDSDLELNRQGTTYTVDTLMHLKALCPEKQLYYVIGADTLQLFPTWKTAGKVATLCHMLVAPRPGLSLTLTQALQLQMLQEYGLSSTLLSQPGPEISSSQVRQHIRRQQPIDHLVPSQVMQYIASKGLYQH